MAVLKPLKLKDKEYIFKAFGNNKQENPAKVIFNRFPMPDESYPIASQKGVLESDIVKNFDNSAKAKEQLVEHIINTIIDNITAQRVDYKKFFETCISHIEDLEYDGKEIKTVKDFFGLPEGAIYQIALETYLYSKDNDVFEITQKKILD
jgi:hypothetical protein